MRDDLPSFNLICAYIVLFAGALAAVVGVVGLLLFGGTPAVYGLVVAVLALTAGAAWYVRHARAGRRPPSTA